ncbi:MAG: AtpZ/AtpI family protein [Candidatus Omnitrophota bacterium]
MKKNNLIYYFSLVTQIGLTVISCILVGLFMGIFLDRNFKTKGVFLVLFVLMGVVAGFYNVYKQILKK